MPDLTQIINSHTPSLDPYESIYKHIHANPELSKLEHATAATIHSHLTSLSDSLEIHPNIGFNTGLAAVLRNGEGPTVLLRADMDALPIPEKTGLPYASTKTMKAAGDDDGKEKPVMHACGHDMHVTCLLAAAELLLNAREEWSGTLLLVFQPAEEVGAGAQAMVDAGLYDNVPVPDVVLGGHVFPMPAGTIGTRRGPMATAADRFHVTLHGHGGHGSQPDRTTDPIILAASTVLRLQTIVSREVPPSNGTVVTVSTLHAGDAENVIADEAHLTLDTRHTDPATREKVLQSMHRIVNAESEASNAPKKPDIEPTSSFPFLYNDEGVTAKLEESFSKHFGEEKGRYDRNVVKMNASEDFGVLGTAVDRPSSFFLYGGTDPELFAKAEKEGRLKEDVPFNHSPYFAPIIHPTLKFGMQGYAVAALTWLAKS